jgi:hypothetical protein
MVCRGDSTIGALHIGHSYLGIVLKEERPPAVYGVAKKGRFFIDRL